MGSQVVKSWELPQIVKIVVQYHHKEDLNIKADKSCKMVLAIIILAEHLISRLPGDNRFTNGLYTFQIKSEQSIENILSELEIDKNDYKCIEENIEELVNLL